MQRLLESAVPVSWSEPAVIPPVAPPIPVAAPAPVVKTDVDAAAANDATVPIIANAPPAPAKPVEKTSKSQQLPESFVLPVAPSIPVAAPAPVVKTDVDAAAANDATVPIIANVPPAPAKPVEKTSKSQQLPESFVLPIAPSIPVAAPAPVVKTDVDAAAANDATVPIIANVPPAPAKPVEKTSKSQQLPESFVVSVAVPIPVAAAKVDVSAVDSESVNFLADVTLAPLPQKSSPELARPAETVVPAPSVSEIKTDQAVPQVRLEMPPTPVELPPAIANKIPAPVASAIAELLNTGTEKPAIQLSPKSTQTPELVMPNSITDLANRLAAIAAATKSTNAPKIEIKPIETLATPVIEKAAPHASTDNSNCARN